MKSISNLSLTGDVPVQKYDAQEASMIHCLCLAHPLDPRGQKIGGIETHVRLLLRRTPVDTNILFLGVDGTGDLKLGQITKVYLDGRSFEFMPVARYADSQVHSAAKRIWQSQTLQFAIGLIRYLGAIRRALKGRNATVELERYEFSTIFKLLGRPIVQVIHGEGGKGEAMDSLIKKYWVVHRFNEIVARRLASAIVCVNPAIQEKVRRAMPGTRKPITFMPVPVDDELFAQRPLDYSDNVLRVVFVGRLDQFKDPPTMFRALRLAWEHAAGKLEFHYIGTSDPGRYSEFEAIESFTVQHGFRKSVEVAELVARCHCGILTSFFEGMPCFLLETLSVGRPFVAVHLPQYDLVIESGISGYTVQRTEDTNLLVACLADRLIDLWNDIRRNAVNPARVRGKVAMFSSNILLANHFALHRKLVS